MMAARVKAKGEGMMRVAQSLRLSRFSWCFVALIFLSLSPITSAQEAQAPQWAPDFPVGSSLPEFSAQDQNGDVRSFADLKGEKGLVLVFSRSFKW